MLCPECGSRKGTTVIDTRPSRARIKRRRECLNCSRRFTTVEINIDYAKEMMQALKDFFQTFKP